ncbi:MAG: hypothetical protein CL661_02805 [Bacteroidetes bacterium]|jgi:hypothetical protein|nr:hypothetical protein [Bacteroidota bacterium]|tara:strand:+ start:2306 stop:3289 length:984 start_codon:yes stop_codon:yes gene_type:complete
MIFIYSCREINVSTVINKNGSFTRIITITGDSTDVLKPDLPYPINDTWKREFKKDTTNDKNYILTYTKFFSNNSLLNTEISEDTGWRKKLNRIILVENEFGFFYSYLSYKEKITAANPFHEYDYKDYLNKEDMLWLTGKKLALNSNDSAKIKEAENKVDDYLQNAITDEIIAILKTGIEKLNNPAIKADQVDSYRDSIETKINEWSDKSTLEFVDFYSSWTHNSEINKLKQIESSQFKNLDKKMQLLMEMLGMEDYKVSVELPGIITETNSLSTMGNKVSWHVTPLSILLEDFNMIVESRVINGWMFVITGIVLLLFIVLTIIKSRK